VTVLDSVTMEIYGVSLIINAMSEDCFKIGIKKD